jgi:serine/threonine protein kinase
MVAFACSFSLFPSLNEDSMSGTDPIIGKKLGDYIIVDILGQGGMARVYRGIDKKLNRYAAVKIIDAHLIREDQEEYRQRFQNEARAIARLNHPNIVGIYQFDQVGTIYYMAMSFIEGKDLRTILKQHARNNTRMRYSEIIQVIYDIGSALDYAHSEGVIHRDIKPSNIMITTNGRRSVLTDFGLALSVPEGTVGNTFGSAHYIAPEQAVSSAQAVPQSDIYSLGVVLFEMLTNRVPFNDPSAMAVAMKHLNEPPPPPSRVNPNIPPKIDQIVLKALDKDPKRRFPTGVAMAQALQTAFESSEGELLDSDSQIRPFPVLGDTPSSSRPSHPSAGSSADRLEATGARKDLLDTWDHPEKTATPRRPLDDEPTVTDSKASAVARAQLMQDIPRRIDRRLLLAGLLALIGVIALFAVVAIMTNNNKSQITPTTLEPTQVIAAVSTKAASSTPVPSPIPTEVAAEDVSPTGAPSQTPLAATAVSTTALPPVPSASPRAAPSNTALPTEVTSATTLPASTIPPVIDPNAPVVLTYNAESLVLVNRSPTTVDVSNLTFVQIDANGNTLDFDSSRWDEGTRPTYALQEGDCLQVMRDDLPTLDKPENCGSRQAWSRVSFPHWFWISSDPAATFEVKRGDMVVATCQISAGQCAFDPNSNG